eukprot:jgi/Tetstr1/423084/TSEL_013855.t1
MPWLIKEDDAEDDAERLFFVHVPRCGGTSLMQHFDVPRKCRQGRCCWWRFGMIYFFYRYKLLETGNFPWRSWENLIALLQFTASMALFIWGIFLRDGSTIPILAYTLLGSSLFMCATSTFIATAPVIGRSTFIRRAYLIVNHYVLLRFMESIKWCTGTNVTGYMMHLTIGKLLRYGYVQPEEMDKVCSMAIVRNPYSRMVSVYMYNRYGPLESFPRFVRSWYKMMRHYRERGETEEWYTPCHGIPQFEFTHEDGKQIVNSVVKQEELKLLKTEDETKQAIIADSSIADLPGPVRRALLGMPHANKRSSAKKWWDYFDQETLDLTYEMYKEDFQVFGYSPHLEMRPDLNSPVPMPNPKMQVFSRNSTNFLPVMLSLSNKRAHASLYSSVRGLAPITSRGTTPGASDPQAATPPSKSWSQPLPPSRQVQELTAVVEEAMPSNGFADTTGIAVNV